MWCPEHRDLATEAEQRKATAAAFRRAAERAETSPSGLREMAQQFRDSAAAIADSSDRNMMLRRAAEYERREAERRSRPLHTVATGWHKSRNEEFR